MKRIIALLTAGMVGLGLALVAAVPAQAAFSDCPSNRVCMWDGSNGGNPLIFAQSWSPGQCVPVTVNNDRANSFRNNLSNGKGVQFYEHANCQGHAMHSTTGEGGTTDPFEAGDQGTFIQQGHISCHCDRDKVSSLWYNN